MAFCHGNGDLARDGCCYVAGEVCPLRWKLEGGRVLEGPGLVDIGSVDDVARKLVGNNPNRRQDVADQAQGLTYACSAAVRTLADDSSLTDDRPGFEAAWAARPEYQPVADAWEAIGKPRSWCPQYGPAEAQCCYAEDETTNEAKRSSLSDAAVTIRQGRSR